MNRFSKILLKIIMAVSFIGIVVFVGIAILNNQNIAYVAYNYISSTARKTDFEDFSLKVNSTLKSSYNGEIDPYAVYIDSAMSSLNDGVDLFLDYLVQNDDITKGDQDKLSDLYFIYISSFSDAKKAYRGYIEAYEYAQFLIDTEGEEDADYAKDTVEAKCAYFIKEYVSCYKSGSAFFKNLTEVVGSYAFKSEKNFSYILQSYMIKNGFVDYSLDFVIDNMNKKINNLTVILDIRTNTNIDNFLDFNSKSTMYGDFEIIINTDFKNFVNSLNKLNIFEWAGNYNSYILSLSEELKTSANIALNFFNLNFKE